MKKEIAYYNDSYQKIIQSKVIDCIKSKRGYEVGKRICQYYICSALLALFRNFIDNLGGE